MYVCMYGKKRKIIFSGRRKQEEEPEETAPVVDEIASSTPTTWADFHLSDLDSKETVGSSRKKIKYADEELLSDSFDDEYNFNTEESEGYRLIDAKNLSTTVSKAHMREKGENFLLWYLW